MKTNKNIYLIGFMASGKTMYGKKLANSLNYDFVDLDQFIEKKFDKKIHEIFNEYGEDYFRKIESEVLSQTFSIHNSVIALGGGTPCYFNNIEKINANGISIYFKANAGILSARLKQNAGNRPLIVNKNAEEISIYVADLLNERETYYSQAKLTCDATKINIQTLVLALMPLL